MRTHEYAGHPVENCSHACEEIYTGVIPVRAPTHSEPLGGTIHDGLSCLWPSANRPADSATTQGRSSLPRSPRQSRHFVQVHFASDQREHLTPHLRYHLWSVQRFSERSSVRSHLLMRYARELHARRSDQAMQTTPKASASRRAGRRTVSLYFMKTRPFQTILALASGS